MDTALPQKFPFILDKNLAANCSGNRVCMSCDIVVPSTNIYVYDILKPYSLITGH